MPATGCDILDTYTVIPADPCLGPGGYVIDDLIFVADRGSIEATRAAARDLLASINGRDSVPSKNRSPAARS